MPRVALVSMPFASADRPSIQLGLLKAIAEQAGSSADTFHYNLDLAAMVGEERYRVMAAHRGRQFGDWLFSAIAFQDQAVDPDGSKLLSQFPADISAWLHDLGEGCDIKWLLRLREVVLPAYIDAIVAGFPGNRFDVVGFTSTFQQNVASFALARRLRAKFPHLFVLFGGANFDGEMGEAWLAGVPWIDAIVSGEADVAFPCLLRSLGEARDPSEVQNVVMRNAKGEILRGPQGHPIEDLDQLPTPDYREYFERADRLGLISLERRRSIDIPFEGARGCWWGAKKHCTFCGLNSDTLRFRAKSPIRVLSELEELSRRHQSFFFEAVDNIMDFKLLDSILPKLGEQSPGFDFFYEVKANLSRDHIRQLRDAGVTRVQPGIESFSSEILRLMRKGVTGLQNINFLRWCRFYGVHAAWNLLWGFPGESPTAYESQASLLPLLHHLQPPRGGGRIWLERFSPLFFERDWTKGDQRQPEASYNCVYPERIDLAKAAYFFDYKFQDSLADDVYESLQSGMNAWNQLWQSDRKPHLTIRTVPGLIEIEDSRDPNHTGVHHFEGRLADVYQLFIDKPRKSSVINASGIEVSEQEQIEVLSVFCERGLMIQDDDKYLALALPTQPKRRV